jgi:membrane-associated phospholipid phosphatase
MARLETGARLVSALFHPLLLPAIAFWLLLFFDQRLTLGAQLLFLGVAICFSVVLIPLYIFWLKQRGVVESMDIVVRRQRLNPLLLGALSYFVGFLALSWLDAPYLVQGLMFCYATNTLLVVFITRWWKVSVHTTAISGPLVALLFQFGPLVIPWFALIPFVGASRVILRRHTVAQVLVGAAIGLLLTMLQLKILFRA